MELEPTLEEHSRNALLEERRKKFEEYIEKQNKTREEQLQNKKQRDLETKNPAEKMLHIQKEFRARQNELEACIDKYRKKQMSHGEVITIFNNLKEFFLSINYALLTFDRQTYKEALDKMFATIAQIKKKNEPRRKFVFKRRDEDFGVKQTVIVSNTEPSKEKEDSYEKSIPGIDGTKSQTMVIPKEELSKPYKIINCSDSTINLNGITEILFLKNLTNCTIRAGPSKSTVFVDNCVGCHFEIACHQLRIHNTTHTTFSVFTTSRAIIEDTKDVIFQTYRHNYEGVEQDMRIAELKDKVNLWREVQDFNWLKQEASPHFTIRETTSS